MSGATAVQWWCSALGTTWNCSWQPYPGVWLFVALFAAISWWLARRVPPGSPRSAWRTLSAVAGLVGLWLTLDWPIGALGAGYLASVHAFQFVMLAMIVPPLLLIGIRPEVLGRLASRPRLLAVVSAVTSPFPSMIVFTIVMVATHMPRVVDALMVSQAGSFVLDMAWFVSGLAFWWPLLVGLPVRPRFVPLLRMVYLFFGTIAHLFIAMWLLISRFPVYATYELAPPFSGLTPVEDQQVAGGVMLGIGTTLVLLAVTIIFFRWLGVGEERADPVTTGTAPAP
jgi:putative membrane protein